MGTGDRGAIATVAQSRVTPYTLVKVWSKLHIVRFNLDLRNATLGYGFHFQQINFRTLPIESSAHDSERTLVCTEYGYPKGSPNTNS
jgi:hypothetical protein